MKRRIFKKFVKAYAPYGLSPDSVLLGMKEEGSSKYWHRGSLVRWWTRERHKQRKFLRKNPAFSFVFELTPNELIWQQ